MFLCSHRCRRRPSTTQNYEICEMVDAARATSAAPTFFDPVRMMKKILVDGGYGFSNNPSQDVWRHYTELKEILQTDRVRWVNMGTGSSNGQPVQSKREWKDFLLPTYIQNIMHTIRDLEKIATDSEQTGISMHLISNMDRSQLDFHRFSATNGVHAISLDDYETIDNKKLESLTNAYLDDPKVEDRLRALALTMAHDYVEKAGGKRITSHLGDPVPVPVPIASPIRQLITGQGPEGLGPFSPGTGVPSMAGASEITADSSNANETPTSKIVGLDDAASVVPLESDDTGVGDQFKTPQSNFTEFRPPTRSSTAPARA